MDIYISPMEQLAVVYMQQYINQIFLHVSSAYKVLANQSLCKHKVLAQVPLYLIMVQSTTEGFVSVINS